MLHALRQSPRIDPVHGDFFGDGASTKNPSLSVAAKSEGCEIETNEGRRVERSEGVLVGLGFAEDGENDAAVGA
jgi:hypothetical protein